VHRQSAFDVTSPRNLGRSKGRAIGSAVIVVLGLVLLSSVPAAQSPATAASPSATAGAAARAATGKQLAVPSPAPRPTSTEASPGAPDPHPPLGGKAPDGSVPGGSALARRGLILPTSAPKLPANLTARSWVLSDLDSGEILAARDPHGRYQPASILKLLTTVTLLPHLPGRRVVTISKAAAAAEGSAVGLLAGATYSVDELFRALMLVSGNDAAAALAEANGGVPTTVSQMNATARALGGYDTFVQTPSGLDGWQQLTSAYDVSLFLRAALAEPRFVGYDRTASATFPAKKSRYGKVGGYQFDNQSLNFLQGVKGALVAKTGFTDAAQHTYVCAAERNGRRLGIVFLRNHRYPLDQFQQAAALLDWGFRLSPTTTPVGTLAGPISGGLSAATGTSTTPDGGTATATGTAIATVTVISNRSSMSTPTAAAAMAGGVLLLAGAGVASLRRKRHR
jgi:D-alanyl-D-alanine carboxypeptidase (penicillin-binding protein 5/6)